MGFFSFLTSDTQESIRHIYSNNRSRTVYLLQPHGQPPVREDAYEGCGVFGGVNCYVWLIEQNAKELGLRLQTLSDADAIHFGIGLAIGVVYEVAATGERLSIDHDYTALVGGCYLAIDRGEIVPGMNRPVDDLIQSGELVPVPLNSLVNFKYPLKFSFNPDADYDQLPAAKYCPDNGAL